MSRDREMDKVAAQRERERRERYQRDHADYEAAMEEAVLALQSRAEELIPLVMRAQAKRGYPGLAQRSFSTRPENPVVRLFKDGKQITISGYPILSRSEPTESGGAIDLSVWLLSNGHIGYLGGSYTLGDYIKYLQGPHNKPAPASNERLRELVDGLERLSK